MCHLYKVVYGFVELTVLMHHYCTCLALITSQDTHAHPLTVLQPQTHTNSYYFSFFSHTVAIWNSLPYFVVSFPNIEQLHVTL